MSRGFQKYTMSRLKASTRVSLYIVPNQSVMGIAANQEECHGDIHKQRTRAECSLMNPELHALYPCTMHGKER